MPLGLSITASTNKLSIEATAAAAVYAAARVERLEGANLFHCNNNNNKLVTILAHEYTHAGWMATARTLRT